MAENQPGNGYTSPFGNGNGAVSGEGPSNGAHDFIADPGNSDKGGGRDFSKESKPQQSGACPVNPESVPAGGPLPFSGAPEQGSTPFRVKGG